MPCGVIPVPLCHLCHCDGVWLCRLWSASEIRHPDQLAQGCMGIPCADWHVAVHHRVLPAQCEADGRALCAPPDRGQEVGRGCPSRCSGAPAAPGGRGPNGKQHPTEVGRSGTAHSAHCGLRDRLLAMDPQLGAAERHQWSSAGLRVCRPLPRCNGALPSWRRAMGQKVRALWLDRHCRCCITSRLRVHREQRAWAPVELRVHLVAALIVLLDLGLFAYPT
mmetsp:Transcript_91577/g.255042  ORF Transcript_91577/g.255042 Transcript_91577/m.255042 type:complete len:221 (-) Transcript_91577:53-715(-)